MWMTASSGWGRGVHNQSYPWMGVRRICQKSPVLIMLWPLDGQIFVSPLVDLTTTNTPLDELKPVWKASTTEWFLLRICLIQQNAEVFRWCTHRKRTSMSSSDQHSSPRRETVRLISLGTSPIYGIWPRATCQWKQNLQINAWARFETINLFYNNWRPVCN